MLARPLLADMSLGARATRSALTALGIAGGAVIAVSLALSLSGAASSSPWGKLLQYFSVDGESNVWSWYSSALWTLATTGFVVLAAHTRAGRLRRALLVFSAVTLLMGLDETVQLHERLSWRLPAFQTVTGAWLVVALPLVLLLGFGLLVLARSIPRTLRRDLIVAGAVFLSGAAVAEAIAGVLALTMDVGLRSPAYVVESHIEEGLEFLGAMLTLSAVAKDLRTQRRALPISTSGPATDSVEAARPQGLASSAP